MRFNRARVFLTIRTIRTRRMGPWGRIGRIVELASKRCKGLATFSAGLFVDPPLETRVMNGDSSSIRRRLSSRDEPRDDVLDVKRGTLQ